MADVGAAEVNEQLNIQAVYAARRAEVAAEVGKHLALFNFIVRLGRHKEGTVLVASVDVAKEGAPCFAHVAYTTPNIAPKELRKSSFTYMNRTVSRSGRLR